MFVCDLRHYLDIPSDAGAPVRRMAEHLTLIVRAATATEAGLTWISALTCQRRPNHRPCPGNLIILRTDVPPSIDWRCDACGDEGVINGWERSPFDFRPRSADLRSTEETRVVIPPEVAATLRGLMLLDSATERLVFRVGVSDEGVVLWGDDDEFDTLIDCVAAEANHEEDRRRQKQLDTAFDLLDSLFTRSQRS